MEAIFSSKLYKSSRRKDKIASALADPVNMELVQQLNEYLTQPEDVAEDIKQDKKEAQIAVGETPKGEAKTPTTEVASPKPPVPAHKHSDPATPPVPAESQDTSELPEKKEDLGFEEKEDLNKFHSPEKPEDKEDEVEESTSVEAATALYQEPVEASCCDAVRIDAEVIKGTLNLRDNTKGVSRILVKDKELWIYYQDNINLNSVMEPVIYSLNSANFSHLEFNRLARSNNAIVFDISCVTQSVEPIIEEEKDK